MTDRHENATPFVGEMDLIPIEEISSALIVNADELFAWNYQ